MTTTTTTETTRWLICANCTDMGEYPGATREDAVAAYARAAGYDSIEAAAEACGLSVAAWRAELDVTEAA